jgi:hypothetical protein
VDFVTAPGGPVPGVFRRGYPSRLVTPLCVMRYDREKGELVLESIHPGVPAEEVARCTGWPIDPEGVPTTPAPTEKELSLLRTSGQGKNAAVLSRICRKISGYLMQVNTGVRLFG